MYSKYKRHNIPGHAHELTFSCFKRQPFLKSDKVKNYIIESIECASYEHDFSIIAYVIMPEHVHLMIYPSAELYSISKILKSIKQPVSKRVINQLRESNSIHLKRMETGLESPQYRFWQDGGGYDRNYFTNKDILIQINYIHNNPIRRGLVENPVEYEWSSAATWLSGVDGLLHVKKDMLLLS